LTDNSGELLDEYDSFSLPPSKSTGMAAITGNNAVITFGTYRHRIGVNRL
jgi:hypothetical protein